MLNLFIVSASALQESSLKVRLYSRAKKLPEEARCNSGVHAADVVENIMVEEFPADRSDAGVSHAASAAEDSGLQS